MYPASQIAFAFVARGIEDGNPLTQMKLQKVVYFAQGLYLVLREGDTLIREDFQAWKYGPVVPVIYHDYKLYGSSPIGDTDWLSRTPNEEEMAAMEYHAKDIIKYTWEMLRDVSGTQLSNWTHKADSPWAKHYKPGVPDIIIPKEDIRAYFQRFKIDAAKS